jgi:hypothetical protein
MSHFLRLPVFALVAVSTILATTPATQAAYSSDLYNSLLNKCYKESSDDGKGDGGDVLKIISKGIDTHSLDDEELVKKLIATLKKNLDKLDENVSEEDLDRIFKKLKKKIRRQTAERNAAGAQGAITKVESPA